MKMPGTDNTGRLDRFYAEAAGPPIDVSATVNRAAIAIDHLIDNVAARIEWNEQEHRRLTRAAMKNGEPPPAPVSLMGELQTIARVVSALQGLRPDFNTADPDAGAREIVRIIQLAREDFSYVEEKSNKGGKEAGKDKMPPETREGGAGDETRQIPSTPEAEVPGIERQSTISRLCLGHGKIRRGSG